MVRTNERYGGRGEGPAASGHRSGQAGWAGGRSEAAQPRGKDYSATMSRRLKVTVPSNQAATASELSTTVAPTFTATAGTGARCASGDR